MIKKIPAILLAFNLIGAVLNARIIEFAGQQWYVKSGYGGPGPNYWSDSEENVWLDANGWLHLKIRYYNGIWYCSEVYTTEFTSYGIHRFYIIARLDSLDRNVVFAPFLYANDTTEIDIEFAKWGQIAPSANAWYVVQPSSNPGNIHSFWISQNGTYTTHYFNWQSDSIRFKSIHGHYQEPPNSGYLIHQWPYTGNDIPRQNENLRVHINLWLHHGIPPSNAHEVEVVVKDVELPLASKMNENQQIDKSPLPFIISNYPNPARSKMTIKYILFKNSETIIRVFNTSGKEIATLTSGFQYAGQHQVVWLMPCGRLSTGVYFIQLEANDDAAIKKIIIVK